MDNATTVTNGVYTTSSVTALSDVSSVGSGSIITSLERNKLSGIAANANNYSYQLPNTSTLGGVKVDGSTITINGSGVISSSGSNLSSSSINDLSDISFDTSSLTNGQSLVWNSTNSRWEAGSPSINITNAIFQQ